MFLLLDISIVGTAVSGVMLLLAMACKLAGDFSGYDISIGVTPEQCFKYFALFGFIFYLLRSLGV